MPTLFEVYKNNKNKLENPSKDEINIRLLLLKNNNLESMSDFYLKRNEEINDLDKFNVDFARFLAGEPIDYIIGETLFFGHKFNVDNRVLIPRQESEEVALYALRKIESIFKCFKSMLRKESDDNNW